MSYVSKIISAFDGVRPMAKAIDKPVSTVKSWESRGSIPDKHKLTILRTASDMGLDLVPADFIPGVDDAAVAK